MSTSPNHKKHKLDEANEASGKQRANEFEFEVLDKQLIATEYKVQVSTQQVEFKTIDYLEHNHINNKININNNILQRATVIGVLLDDILKIATNSKDKYIIENMSTDKIESIKKFFTCPVDNDNMLLVVPLKFIYHVLTSLNIWTGWVNSVCAFMNSVYIPFLVHAKNTDSGIQTKSELVNQMNDLMEYIDIHANFM
jgi:hypothetical protein